MGAVSDNAESRHFSGSMTKYLVDYFRLHGSPGALERVLENAGEDRSIDVLGDETSWTSYTRMRALLESAAAELGGVEHLATVAASCIESISTPEFTAALQDRPDAFR